MDLMTMMTRVCRKVAYEFESNATREYMNRKKQVPCITSMLTRDVYFTPKAKMSAITEALATTPAPTAAGPATTSSRWSTPGM